MSFGITCGTHWVGRLGACPGWNIMSPCFSTLRGGTGDSSGVVFGVCTLVGGVTSGAAALGGIYASCLSAAICSSPSVVIGIVGVGLRRLWVWSTAACVAASFEEILGKVSVDGGKYVVSDTIYFPVLGM